MSVYKRGPWLIPFVLNARFFVDSPILKTEVIGGYGDHQETLLQIKGDMRADILFRLKSIATALVASDEVREIQVVGHADRVWSHGVQDKADEDRVSQHRAEDVFAVFKLVLSLENGGPQMLIKMDRNEIGVFVVGVGSRHLLYKDREHAAANRRVEIQLWKTRSIPI